MKFLASFCCVLLVGLFVSNTAHGQACNTIFNSTSGTPFQSSDIKSMEKYFMSNVNINGQGGVVASPDTNTPGGSYYFHWARDGALSMRAVLTALDGLNNYETELKNYVQWVLNIQSESADEPNNIDVRVEPKFNLPNGDIYTGAWCRPQTDGAPLRATTLMMLASELESAGQSDYVDQYLWTGDGDSYNGGAIKYDLDWAVDNWNSNGCDLWEEIESTDFFWGATNFKKALLEGAQFAQRHGDSDSADRYTDAAGSVDATLDGHWNGNYVMECDARQVDGAVISAFNDAYTTLDGDAYHPVTDSKVPLTISHYMSVFCDEYSINQGTEAPGILFGRYPGDTYAGGNPWILLTASLAELFYRAATFTNEMNPLLKSGQVSVAQEWLKVMPFADLDDADTLAQQFTAAGDSVMQNLYSHISEDGFHCAEQLDKNTGYQISAADLTWSYANMLKAVYARTQINNH